MAKTEVAEPPVDDDELTALALAADPETDVPEDAVALPEPGNVHAGLLPAWYMPPAVAPNVRHPRMLRAVVMVVVASLLLINALGLCITYGRLSIT